MQLWEWGPPPQRLAHHSIPLLVPAWSLSFFLGWTWCNFAHFYPTSIRLTFCFPGSLTQSLGLHMDHEWNFEKMQCLLKHTFSGRLSGNDGSVWKLSNIHNIHPNVCHFRWFEARLFWTSAELFQKTTCPTRLSSGIGTLWGGRIWQASGWSCLDWMNFLWLSRWTSTTKISDEHFLPSARKNSRPINEIPEKNQGPSPSLKTTPLSISLRRFHDGSNFFFVTIWPHTWFGNSSR